MNLTKIVVTFSGYNADAINDEIKSALNHINDFDIVEIRGDGFDALNRQDHINIVENVINTFKAKGKEIILSNSTYQQISVMALRTPNTRIGPLRLEHFAAVISTLPLLLLQLLQESLLAEVLLLIMLLVALLMGKRVCQVSFYSCCLQCSFYYCFFFCRHCC